MLMRLPLRCLPSRATLALVALACVLLPSTSAAQFTPPAGLPADVVYDPQVPTPASVLGWEVGDWHVRPDQIVRYFEVLAEASPRVQLETYARTHEQRPLLLATISSPSNLADIEGIRGRHVAAVRAGEAPAVDRPVVVWMGYSVHGNEPSGANASLLVAYYLAAAQGAEIDAILGSSVVLMDPCINPDGLGRFAHWANIHKGRQLVADARHREHGEGWPGGRTNHYWFDLNRDWLLLTHPESRGRIERFQAWKPNLLTDHHEMGTSSTFFFQPGVPSRQNPRTPARNLELTRAVAAFHAEALDAAGRIYYSEEGFDDFYYGKGSTYPDVQGAVGILFEQASSRGHLQTNSWGELAFPTTIQNQVLTSLSSLRAAHALRRELLEMQADAARTAREEAQADPVAAYVFGDARDGGRPAVLADILRRHDIEVHALDEVLDVGGVHYEPGRAYVVPCHQLQYRLLKSIFESRTEFADDTFYDVSTWVLPLAFGLEYAELDRPALQSLALGERVTSAPRVAGSLDRGAPDEDVVAYAFEWHGLHAPRALARLMQAGVVPQVATRPFEGVTSNGKHAFDYGTILVPVGVQTLSRREIHELMQAVAGRDDLDVLTLVSGLTPDGIDLGSPSARTLKTPRPALLVGSGVSSYEAGEVWHQLDLRWELPVALLELDAVGERALADYTHLLVVGGGTGSLSGTKQDAIRDWVRGGGVLIATSGAAGWATRDILGDAPGGAKGAGGQDQDKDQDKDKDKTKHEDTSRDDASDAAADPDTEDAAPARIAYADYEADRAKTLVSGTIFETRLDLTHPLAFGFSRETLPVFRSGKSVLEPGKDPYADACLYTEAPLLAGYAAVEAVEKIAGTVAATARRMGRGTVVRIQDDPLFRGFWYGTARLYANALFFGPIIKSTGAVTPLDEGQGSAAAGLGLDEH
jgi:hypothetical protein